MTLSFVSAILPELSREEVLDLACDIGYDSVELMCWPEGPADRRYAGVTHLDVAAVDAVELAFVCREKEVGISAFGYYPNVLSTDAEEAAAATEHLRNVIVAAGMTGVGIVNTFVGRDPMRSVNDQWDRFVEVWTPLVQEAEKREVRIGIENCPMYFTHDEWPSGKNLAVSPAIWRRMFEAIPSPAWGLNYDPSHLVWQMIDPIRPIAEFGPRLVHAHAKDARVYGERLDDVGILATPLEYHEPVLPGRGSVDWLGFFEALRSAGYEGAVAVEVEDIAYEGSLEDRKRALQESHDFLRRFVPRQAP